MARRTAPATTILPIGHYVGAFHPGPDAPLEHHALRIGSMPLRLASDDELGVWALAHGLPGQGGRLWTRDDVLALAKTAEISDAATILDELIADDVLIEVAPDSPQAIEFAADHRVVGLLAGSVTPPATNGVRAIGIAGHPMVELDELGFELWRFGHLADSLWDYCELLADGLRASGEPAVAEITPERLLPDLLVRVRELLAHSAAYLDEATGS